MCKIEKIKQLGECLPFGGKTRIAEMCDCSSSIVVQFLKGKVSLSVTLEKKIIKAALVIIGEQEKEKNEVNKLLDKVK